MTSLVLVNSSSKHHSLLDLTLSQNQKFKSLIFCFVLFCTHYILVILLVYCQFVMDFIFVLYIFVLHFLSHKLYFFLKNTIILS